VIQIAINDTEYRATLRRLLEDCESRSVECVSDPDPTLECVLVLDAENLRRLPLPIPHPERVVLVAGNRTEDVAAAWQAGLRSVVLRDDPVTTAVLAVLSAGLNIPDSSRKRSPRLPPDFVPPPGSGHDRGKGKRGGKAGLQS